MEIISFLKEPLVGSIIGIAGIVIGSVLALTFYIKSKIIAKPKYSIENVKLIDLNAGEIPPDVIMTYKDSQIRFLTKTIIRIWNSGKKTIDKTDLEPSYVEIPFEGNNPDITQFLNINITTSRSNITVSNPSIEGKLNIRFSFNFLDYKDQIRIEILHTARTFPKRIAGYVKGVPKGFINVSERQEKLVNSLLNLLTESNSIFISPIELLKIILQNRIH